MKRFVIVLLIISCLVIFVGCSKVTSSDNENSVCIKGRITDQNHVPVSGAKLYVEYYVSGLNSKPSTPIAFQLPETGNVKVWVSHHQAQDTVIVLKDSSMTSGYYTLFWNSCNSLGQMVLGNYYDVHIKTDTSYQKRKLFFDNLNYGYADLAQLSTYEYNGITDNQGNYSIDVNGLPFSFSDNQIDITNELGEVTGHTSVQRYVKLWAIHPDHTRKCIDSLYVAPNQNTLMDFVLQ